MKTVYVLFYSDYRKGEIIDNKFYSDENIAIENLNKWVSKNNKKRSSYFFKEIHKHLYKVNSEADETIQVKQLKLKIK